MSFQIHTQEKSSLTALVLLQSTCFVFAIRLRQWTRLTAAMPWSTHQNNTESWLTQLILQTNLNPKPVRLTHCSPWTCRSRSRSRWGDRSRGSLHTPSPWLHPRYGHWSASKPKQYTIKYCPISKIAIQSILLCLLRMKSMTVIITIPCAADFLKPLRKFKPLYISLIMSAQAGHRDMWNLKDNWQIHSQRY